MLESLFLAGDPKLNAAIEQMCASVGISPRRCSGAEQGSTLLARNRFYGVIVHDADPLGAAQLLQAIRRSSSSKRAVSIAVLRKPSSLGAAFELRTPMAADLALRTFRAARAAMLSEFRRSGRHAVEAPVIITTAAGQELHGKSINLSQTGLALKFATRLQLTAKTTVRGRLVLPPSGTLVEIKGEVAWSDAEGRAGLQIQAVTARDRQNLEEWTAQRG